MKAYSFDLWAKIAQAGDEGAASRRQLARQFRVSVAVIQKMLRRRRLPGRLAAAVHTGGRRGLLGTEALALVAHLLREQNDLTLAVLCERVADVRGVHGSVPTMYRAVRRLQCMDESGLKLAMTRLYGRAPRGARALGSAPQNSGQNVTILGALSCTGLEAVMTIEGATDADVFRADVCEVLCPTLRVGDIVIADNLSAHKAAGVQEAIAATGARLLSLPLYSPDLNPIERCWSKLKTYLRAAKARTCAALDAAVMCALATVTESDARAWFAHCGYVLP
jgi:transposase